MIEKNRRRCNSRILDRRQRMRDNKHASRSHCDEESLQLDNFTPYCIETMPKEIQMSKFKDRVKVGSDTRWVTGNTRHELHLAIATTLIDGGEIAMPAQANESCPTVREFIEQIYKPTYIDQLAPKTIENYKQYLKLNILPFLGDMRLDEVNVSTIQQFYNWMASASQRGRKKDLNVKTIQRISGFASRIFKVAQEMKLIEDTPFKTTLLSIRAEAAGHHKALPDDVIQRVKQDLLTLEIQRDMVYMALLVYTGMRLEEILGLCWENVNLEEKYCVITQTATFAPNGNANVRQGAKSAASCRTVILPEPLVGILRSVNYKEGYVVGSVNGTKPLAATTYRQMHKRVFRLMGLGGYTNHDFRTTYATQLCEKGISSKAVADLMGHADTRMVETIYARRRHEGIMKYSGVVNSMHVNGNWATQE